MEYEPQTEPIKQYCNYCGPGYPATWEIISENGQEFVCDKHHIVLNEIRAIQREKLLWEAEWTLNSHYEEDLAEHEFDDIDQWEDGSLYGF
jgi:hypothetical protein